MSHIRTPRRQATRDVVLTQDFFPKVGGAHLWLYEVYRRWPSEVEVLTDVDRTGGFEDSSPKGAFAAVGSLLRIERKDIRIEQVNLLDPRCIARFGSVVSKLKRRVGNGSACVHCLRAFPEGFAGLLLKRGSRRRIKLVTYAHGEEILVARSSRQLGFMARVVYRHSDLVICNSYNTKRLVQELCPSVHAVCIHPGVDVDAFEGVEPDDVRAHRSRWGWPEDTIVVSTLARMEPRKNHAMVVRAIAELRRKGLPVAYVCGSDGEEKGKLEHLVEVLDLEEWVYFTGTLSNAEKLLTFRASDIYAMPSIQSGPMIEGFGIVFLEAAASGIPSICGNIGGQAEAVLHEKTGLVVDGQSLTAVEQAIRMLASDLSVRRRMGSEGKRWAAANDWDRVAEKTWAAVCA